MSAGWAARAPRLGPRMAPERAASMLRAADRVDVALSEMVEPAGNSSGIRVPAAAQPEHADEAEQDDKDEHCNNAG